MCPNCILNQAGLQGGVYVSFAVCFVFFVAAVAGMYFAFKNGDFDDMEGSKFDMLDDEEDSSVIMQAKARVEAARARTRSEQVS